MGHDAVLIDAISLRSCAMIIYCCCLILPQYIVGLLERYRIGNVAYAMQRTVSKIYNCRKLSSSIKNSSCMLVSSSSSSSGSSTCSSSSVERIK